MPTTTRTSNCHGACMEYTMPQLPRALCSLTPGTHEAKLDFNATTPSPIGQVVFLIKPNSNSRFATLAPDELALGRFFVRASPLLFQFHHVPPRDAKTLDAFLSDPQKAIPGNVMPFPGLADAKQRAEIVDYLKNVE